jgi:predicted membrane protein
MTAILIVLLVFCTFWKAKDFANRIGAAATTKLCLFVAGMWAFSFFSIWLILLISQFAGKTPYWPQPWQSVVSVIYGLTCILPLPVLSLAPYTK